LLDKRPVSSFILLIPAKAGISYNFMRSRVKPGKRVRGNMRSRVKPGMKGSMVSGEYVVFIVVPLQIIAHVYRVGKGWVEGKLAGEQKPIDRY